MDEISHAVDLTEEIKSRSHAGAAAKLAELPGAELARLLMHLSPGFAQDVLGALPEDARSRAIAAAPADIARQWQVNAAYWASSPCAISCSASASAGWRK
jgi:hypothetical protein